MCLHGLSKSMQEPESFQPLTLNKTLNDMHKLTGVSLYLEIVIINDMVSIAK